MMSGYFLSFDDGRTRYNVEFNKTIKATVLTSPLQRTTAISDIVAGIAASKSTAEM